MNNIEPHIFFDADDKDSLSRKLIRDNNWHSVVIKDFPDLIQCEWLEKAFQGDVYYSFYNFKEDKYCGGRIQNDKYVFIEKVNSYLLVGGVLYSSILNGCCFCDLECYIICGSREFMETAYPVSFSTAKEMFFSSVIYLSDDVYAKKASDYFIGKWNRYAVEY